MDTVKFDEKSLSRYPMASYFSDVEAFGKRNGPLFERPVLLFCCLSSNYLRQHFFPAPPEYWVHW